MKWTIRKMDEHNWQLFEWQEGGEIISRGRYAGQETTAKWKPLDSYHRSPAEAARALLSRAMLANVEPGTDLDTAAIIAAQEKAVRDVEAALGRLGEGDPN